MMQRIELVERLHPNLSVASRSHAGSAIAVTSGISSSAVFAFAVALCRLEIVIGFWLGCLGKPSLYMA
jgi:hypothetical protein